jgi:hypothetical protein
MSIIGFDTSGTLACQVDVIKENIHRKMLLDMIHLLYDANAREQGMDAVARTMHRQENSLPVLTAIKKYMDSLTDQFVLPKSALADALRYLHNHIDRCLG